MWKRVNNAIYAMKRKKELFSCNLCHFVCCPKCFIVKNTDIVLVLLNRQCLIPIFIE